MSAATFERIIHDTTSFGGWREKFVAMGCAFLTPPRKYGTVPPVVDLAHFTGLSSRTVRKYLATLRASGMLDVAIGAGRAPRRTRKVGGAL